MHLLLSSRIRHPGHFSSSICSSSLNSSSSSWIADRTGLPLTLIVTGVTIASLYSFLRSLAAYLSHDLIIIGFLRLSPRSVSLPFSPFRFLILFSANYYRIFAFMYLLYFILRNFSFMPLQHFLIDWMKTENWLEQIYTPTTPIIPQPIIERYYLVVVGFEEKSRKSSTIRTYPSLKIDL